MSVTASIFLEGLKCSQGEILTLFKSMGVLPLNSNKTRFPLGSLKVDGTRKHLGRIAVSSQEGQAELQYGIASWLIENVHEACFFLTKAACLDPLNQI